MWQEKNIEIDAVSEKYRKYIIGIYHEEKSWYVLWGADLSTKDETDKLWLNQHKEILLFDNIEAIRKVVLSHRYRLFDDNNLMQWAKDHASNQAYASYDLDRIKLVITIRNILKNIIPENCMEIVTFVNLFSNYAYQQERERGDKTLLILHQEKEVRTFFDYAYDNYVWDNPEHAGYRSLNELDYLRFDEEKFQQHIRQMLSLFMENTAVWQEH